MSGTGGAIKLPFEIADPTAEVATILEPSVVDWTLKVREAEGFTSLPTADIIAANNLVSDLGSLISRYHMIWLMSGNEGTEAHRWATVYPGGAAKITTGSMGYVRSTGTIITDRVQTINSNLFASDGGYCSLFWRRMAGDDSNRSFYFTLPTPDPGFGDALNFAPEGNNAECAILRIFFITDNSYTIASDYAMTVDSGNVFRMLKNGSSYISGTNNLLPIPANSRLDFRRFIGSTDFAYFAVAGRMSEAELTTSTNAFHNYAEAMGRA